MDHLALYLNSKVRFIVDEEKRHTNDGLLRGVVEGGRRQDHCHGNSGIVVQVYRRHDLDVEGYKIQDTRV